MKTNRPYVQIDQDVLERVRQIDLLSYLREFEPSNLVKVKGTSNVYCTAEHDSLKISNGKWYWWSRGFGGYSALDYLIKVKEYYFVEAVEILTGQTMADWKPPPDPKKDEPKVLLLPPMLMYGKEASNRKQEIDRQHYTIPNQRPKDKHFEKI